MRFHVDQELPGASDAVIAVLLDPAFLAELGRLPKLGAPELLEQRREGEVVHQRVRYRFTGSLSPAVTRVIDPNRLVWEDETTYDVAARLARFRILPEHYSGRLRCEGTYRFEEAGEEATLRIVDGELNVSYPIVGRAVERAIVSGLEEHLEAEAELVAEWLQRS